MKCNCGWICVTVLALVGAAGVATSLRADPTDKKGQPSEQMPVSKAMEKCMELGKPGEIHQQMKAMVGTWNAECSMWMDPKGEPQKSTGTVNYTSFGDRFIKGEFKGEMGPGMPFIGHEIVGYNNATQEVESIWYSDMGTGIMFQTGKNSADGKTCTLTSQTMAPTEPDGKMAMVKFRTVVTHTDNNHFTMEMFATEPTKPEARVMKINYHRASAK